jgi:hypothetical protein
VSIEADLLEFLVEAKKATYAAHGDGAYIPPLLAGSKQLEYFRGDFGYRDIYFGSRFFVGQETVYRHHEPLWSMVYSGGIRHPVGVDVSRIYSFLRQAMRLVSPDNPYRGPAILVDGDFVYTESHNGDTGRFDGRERIFCCEREVYALVYTGGYLAN